LRKNYLLIISLLTVLFACVQEEKFPPKLTQQVSNEKLKVTGIDSIHASVSTIEKSNSEHLPGCLEQLILSVNDFHEKNEGFIFDELKESWETCKTEITTTELKESAAIKWIEATGLLLQLTTDTKYGEELQHVFLNSYNLEIKNRAASYVFTKNVDHIHINLFLPAEINYQHSLAGDVQILQETNYPESGKGEVHFSMSKRRYIELYIRIPSWADDAHVTVKGVKYFAPAGGYCKIAKKWREGDLVEIVFPGIHGKSVI